MKRKITDFAFAGIICGFGNNGFPVTAFALLKNPSLASMPVRAVEANPPPML